MADPLSAKDLASIEIETIVVEQCPILRGEQVRKLGAQFGRQPLIGVKSEDPLDVRIELATPKSLPPDLRQITATITAQPSEAALIALLERVERAPHLIVVDRLNVKQQPGPYLDMVLISYARIGPKIAGKTDLKPAARDETPAGSEPQ